MKISFFIFVMITLYFSGVQSQSLPVLDTDGNLLVNGASYYILPAISYRGGGVKLTPTTLLNQTCPLDVSQENNPELDGIPLTFLPAIPSIDGIIRQSRDLNIRFSNGTSCGKAAVWRVAISKGQRLVTIGGIIGRPGWYTIFNWFKIEKYDNDYKIVYCPTACSMCRPLCGGVGSTIAKTGRRSLILSNEDPLKVKFKKV